MQDFGEDVILGVKEHEKWIQIKPTYRPCNFHQSLDLRCVAKCCFCSAAFLMAALTPYLLST